MIEALVWAISWKAEQVLNKKILYRKETTLEKWVTTEGKSIYRYANSWEMSESTITKALWNLIQKSEDAYNMF